MPPNKPYYLVASLARSSSSRLRRFFFTRVRNAADIPDLIQEVFLRMLRMPESESIRNPEAYLFTIAAHVAQQHSLRGSAGGLPVDVDEVFEQLMAAADSDPFQQVQAQQSLENLSRALDRLSPKVRATFVLHRHYGMTLQEISRTLNVSLPMAKKYLTKALWQVREHLESHA